MSAILEWAYPPPDSRGTFDRPNTLLFLAPLALHAVTIHLLLRHHHRPIANALRSGVLLPLNIIASIRAGFGAWLPPLLLGPNPAGKDAPSWAHYTVGGAHTQGGVQHIHVAIGIFGAYSVLKALEWGLAVKPPRLRKELLDVVRAERQRARLRHRSEGESKERRAEQDDVPDDYLPRFVPNTRIPLGLDLLVNMRGVGWTFGVPYDLDHLPTIRPTPGSAEAHALNARRTQLIRSRLRLALALFLLVDAVDSCLKSQALFGHRANLGGDLALGGVAAESLRYEYLPRWKTALLTLLAGITIPTAMQATYSLVSALSLLPARLFPHSDWVWATTLADPAHWAPLLMRAPHKPKDVRGLWADEWHALFRAPFLAVAYRPVDGALKALGLGVDAKPRQRGQNGGTATSHAQNGVDPSKHVQRPPTIASSKSNQSAWRGAPGLQTRRALSVLAVFLLSGLMHEAGQLALARTPAEREPLRMLGLGSRVEVYRGAGEAAAGVVEKGRLAYVDRGGRALTFFLMQGLACIAEDGLEALFARKRRSGSAAAAREQRPSAVWSVLRWAWVAAWIFGWGHYVAKTWYRMGIAQGLYSFRVTGTVAQVLWRAFSRAGA